MKSIIANIVGGKSLTYLAAAFAAFAVLPRQTQASNVWVGKGDDEYFGTTGNTVGGPAGRGMFFVDGINDLNGTTRYASNWTVRFGSYTKIAGTPIYVGRACLTDPDKIWTFIADNDDYGFYLDSGYNMEVGWSTSYGDGYLRILNGKSSVNGVYIGPDADNPATKGVLCIGSEGHTSSLAAAGDIAIRNGALTTINTAISCGKLTAANKEYSSVTIDKTGGDWIVNNGIEMSSGNGSNAKFYHRAGDLVVNNNLTVQSTGSGEFYMNGGHVTVSNWVSFASNYLSSGNKANLYLNGGVLEAKAFRFHNCDYSTGNVIFNGGTYKALADGDIAVHEGRMGYGYLLFKVGALGGTIDTAGHDVISPFQLLKNDSGSGGLIVKGGGSLTLSSNTITYNGKTFLEAGTLLAVSNDTAAANFLASGIELIGTPAPNADYTIFVCNKALTNSDLDNVTCDVAEITKSIGADGKSIVVTCTATKDFSGFVPRYTGPANGSLSDAANWTPAGVPTSGNVYIHSATAANLTVGDTFSPSAITFLPGSAAVTISGRALADIESVNNLSAEVQTFANSVAFLNMYRVNCDGRAVNFAGGATATYPDPGNVDNVATHVLMGDITFTADWAQGQVAYSYTVPNGSHLQAKDVRGTSTSGVPNGCFLVVEAGGVVDCESAFACYNKSRISIKGELNVTGVFAAGDSSVSGQNLNTHVGFDGDETGAGILRASGVWKCSRSQVYVKVPTLYIGADGIGSKEIDYAIHFDGKPHTVYATDDFEIFGNARDGYLWDWGIAIDQPVTFNTQGYTINWTAGADGSGALVKDGDGTLIFNPYGTRLSGAVTVKGGTLKVMSASGISTGATTVKDGGTLELAIASDPELSNAVVLEAGSTLVYNSIKASGIYQGTFSNVTLPTSGAATLRINGTRLLSGSYTIMSGVPADAIDHIAFDMASAALDGRKRVSLAVDGSNLVLTILPTGTVITLR